MSLRPEYSKPLAEYGPPQAKRFALLPAWLGRIVGLSPENPLGWLCGKAGW
jgi:hypothetical protein